MSARLRRMRASIAVCEVPEQTEKSSAELFSHVSAGRTQSARSRGVSIEANFKDERTFMLSGQGTLRGGAGLLANRSAMRWSLPGAVRIGHNSVPKGVAFVSEKNE